MINNSSDLHKPRKLMDIHFESLLKRLEGEFVDIKKYTIYLATWNINAEKPKTVPNFIDIFDFSPHGHPDIVVVGFEELVKLNSQNIMLTEKNSNSNKVIWR